MDKKRRIEYIFCVVIIWGTVLVQGWALTKESGEEKSLEVFETLQLSSINGCVEVSATVNKLYLNQKEKENVLVELARELGILTGYEMKDDSRENTERMVLTREQDGENISLSITTIHVPVGVGSYKQNQYIYMSCSEEMDAQKLLGYKILMEKMMIKRGLNPVTNLNFQGSKNGKMTQKEKENVTNRLFHSLKAKEVESVKEEDLYTVYGYSDLLKDSVAYGENEINLNLAFSYDEKKEKTVFYLSMPYIRMDY